MKKNICFLLLLIALLFVSCDTVKKPQETEPSAQQLTNVPTEAINTPTQVTDTSAEATDAPAQATDAPTQESAVGTENVALIFYNYDDYVLFTQRKVDRDGADSFYGYPSYFYDCIDPKIFEKTFIDIKALLNLSEITDDLEEQIVVEDERISYSVYSKCEDGSSLFEYNVDLRYSPEESLVLSPSLKDAPIFDSVKENEESTGIFLVRNDRCRLTYTKKSGVYASYNINFEDYRLRFSFTRETGWTPAQIEEKCGMLVASFVSENDEELSNGVKTIATALGQES